MKTRAAACTTAILLSIVSLWSSPAGADGATVCLDPTFGAGGHLEIGWPDDTWYPDRMVLDHSGRLLVLSGSVVNDEYYSDRLQRFNVEGSLDTSFGVGGSVDLPGEMYSDRARNVAVDAAGRIWVMRSSWLNVMEFRRLHPDGAIDSTFAPVEVAVNGEVEYVASVEITQEGLRAAWGAETADPAGSVLQWVTVWNAGNFTGGVSSVFSGRQMRVFDSYQGWMVGVSRSISDPDDVRGFAYEYGNNSYLQPYLTPELGWLNDVEILDDGRIVAVGESSDGNDNWDGYVVQLRDATPGSSVVVETGFGAVSTDFGGDGDVIFGILPDGTVLTGRGDDQVVVGRGSLQSDGTVRIKQEGTVLSGAALPPAVRQFADGSVGLSGYLGYDGYFVTRFSARHQPAESGALRDQIARLYRAYFARTVEATGGQFWQDQLLDGVELSVVSDAFASSPEFLGAYGTLANREFVELVYLNVLGRNGDAAGVASWTAQLDSRSMTRGGVMTAFSESRENIIVTGTVPPHTVDAGSVQRLYQAYFERSPELSGSCYWTLMLGGSMGLGQISDFFAGSEEFSSKYGELGNREFVELVYENVLGRVGEESGVAYWTAQLDGGHRTRGEIMIGFSEGIEFVRITGTLPPS